MLRYSSQLPIGGIINIPGSSQKYKTGTWRTFYPSFPHIRDGTKCIHCLFCVRNCPENCIKITPRGKRGEVDFDYCKGCGICAEVCPVKVITMKKSV
jgi:2-oxoacid:acceptor oxidoreductase delta subunit (pyruvate/2-ketoisovalerate family)